MNTYAIYSVNDGTISLVHIGDKNTAELQLSDGYLATRTSTGVSTHTHYVDIITSEVKLKGDYMLDTLPLPCTVTIEGIEYICEQQPVFSFDSPGKYVISVDAGSKFLKKEFTIDYKP